MELSKGASFSGGDSDCSDSGLKYKPRSTPGSPHSKNTTSGMTANPMRVPDAPAAVTTISPPQSKRRDRKTNTEAVKLRNQISMTDYEIQRLNKSLRKRSTNLQVLESQTNLSEENQLAALDYNSEIQALHAQISRLSSRQQTLKDGYLELTGVY